MAMHTQRLKVKSLPRSRGNRTSVNSVNFPKVPPTATRDDNTDIFANSELTYVLGRHVIGNIAEVTTVENERLFGVFKAVSPSGDVGLGYPYKHSTGKNGHINGTTYTVPLANWKLVRIPNVKISDCLSAENKPDSDIPESELTIMANERELVPFFGSSDAPKDCFLNEGGFSVEEMFKTNKELFSVSTTYNPDLPEYKTPVDKNAPDYSATEARCAQLAREIEASEVRRDSFNHVADEESDDVLITAVCSASAETACKAANAMSRSPIRYGDKSEVSLINKQMARVSVQSVDSIELNNAKSPLTNAVRMVSGDGIRHVPCSDGDSTTRQDTAVTSSVTIDKKSQEPAAVSTSASTPQKEIKAKKSTLDPNAPLFQPLSMQSNACSSASASGTAQSAVHNLTAVYSVPSGLIAPVSVPIQSVAAFVPSPQAQIYVPSSMSYFPHSSTVPHIIPAASSNANAVQHARVNSVPLSLPQQGFQNLLTPHNGFLLQSGQQQGASIAQVMQSPALVSASGGAHRFVNSTVPRQNSTDNGSTASQGSYGPASNITVPAVQSPFYQLPPAGTGIPLWLAGAPPVGFNFVPNPGTSSALMVSNIQLQQAPGQQLYPAHAMVHMPPQLAIPTVPMESTPPSAPQGQPSLFQPHPGQFTEHHMQIPQYAQGVVFTQPTGSFYPAAPILTGPGVLNPAMRAGILPMLNQSATSHTVPPGANHQTAGLDPASINSAIPATFPQPNCQPQQLQHYNAAHQLLQTQHLAPSVSMNSQSVQPEAYQNFVALLARNFSSQAH